MNRGLEPLSIAALVARGAGGVPDADVLDEVMIRVRGSRDSSAWIGEVDEDEVRRAWGTRTAGRLAGVPYAVKDNIDVAGRPTTVACPAFQTVAGQSAMVVRLLADEGATIVGKTNLDQFATGLTGCRSPYGTPRNPMDPTLVPGGSSSGSAVAVAAGTVPFALGTDTAGSVRVPAAMTNIVGLKPTRGLVSAHGVTPACRSLDCVGVLALTAEDAATVFGVIDRYDPCDIYARPPGSRLQRSALAPDVVVVGVPDDGALSLCDARIAVAFERHVHEMQSMGVRVRRIEMAPFFEVGDMMYGGPWVAERLAAVGGFISDNPDEVLPVVRDAILAAVRFTAADVFESEYRRRHIARVLQDTVWSEVDAMIVPSVPFTPTLAEVAADPIGTNTRLGRFASFVNLLDLCAVAVPGGSTDRGIPTGFTLIAPACHDNLLLGLADAYERVAARASGALVSTPCRSPVPLHVRLVDPT